METLFGNMLTLPLRDNQELYVTLSVAFKKMVAKSNLSPPKFG